MHTQEITHGLQLCLPANLDLASAEELCSILNNSKGQPEVVKLKLLGHDVERISTAAIQVILCAAASYQTMSKELILSSPSEKLQTAFELLGLKSQLNELSVDP